MIIEYTSDISNLITNKADLVDGKVPAEQLPSYVDDVIEFNNVQAPDTQISIIVGNNSYKNQIRFINGSSTSSNRIGSEDKYPDMFVNFGENTSEDDWTTFEPEKGKIYVNTTNNHSYRWSGSQLIDLDKSWSQGIEDLQENTVSIKPQTLTEAQQAQAFENLGWKVHVISESAIGSSDAVSDDEKEARLAATALLVQETGEMYTYGHNSSSTPSDRRFYRFRDTKTLALLNVVTTTGLITQPLFVNIYDENAVSFNTDQSSVSNGKKNKALGNIGIDLVRLPYSLLGTTLSDEMANVINNARGIILVDTPNDFISPTIYNRGSTTPSSAKFITIGETKDVYYISYNKNTKALANVVHTYTDTGCVRYNQAQDLTTSQQDTALSNIGLNWIHVSYSLLNTVLDDDTYTKLTSAFGIILSDAPSGYYGPLGFICGANNGDGTKVFVGLNLGNTSAYIALYVNHNLTNVRYLRTYDGAVPYDASKTLTSDQQDVALSNIGLNFVHVDYSLLGTTLTDEMFAVLDNAKGIILVNLPSGYYNPFVFIKGNNTSKKCIFVGFATGTTYCKIELNKSTKVLSNINSNLTYIGTVRYIETQNLATSQQDTVLSNIGLDFIHLDYSLLNTTLDDSTAALVENAKGIILTNTPENYSKASVFLKSNYSADLIYFNAWNGITLVSQFYYNTSTKKLTAIGDTDLHFDSIRYAVSQGLTDAQKQQARSNIGATSCYDEYKLAGGTKYTTEADFNAQLVKVMDMTVVE